ncbi:hypothetical protein AVV66_gp182 [Escherichia phage vB_EcoM_VR26]|uniref:Uncharacterized protein n=1 Tax=Escherichia phage vB_EcoM_VR26 TaxID=1567029 RepID=A0A0A7HDQ4_9CAUD|nr:hypothetical protein AVV66_gp182 [Escherichia phage vB_EcoM_VR26]AIZ02892.1 hypothetical protein VR26_255 [Escherichia phage vB_EcoM_VR26]
MMETGKFYTLDPAAKKQFIAGSPDDNSRMIKLMEQHGSSFKVLDMCYIDGDYFVEKVEMKDGTILDSMDGADEYFELAEWEFRHFLEVDEDAPVVDTQTIHVQVNHKNAAEVIALIKATFGI